MPRPQFTLRALLVAMLIVGAFLGGAVFGTKREQEHLVYERAEVEKTRQQMRDEGERDLLEWRIKMLEENNEALKQELRSTMFDLMKAEAKLQVISENAEKAGE